MEQKQITEQKEKEQELDFVDALFKARIVNDTDYIYKVTADNERVEIHSDRRHVGRFSLKKFDRKGVSILNLFNLSNEQIISLAASYGKGWEAGEKKAE